MDGSCFPDLALNAGAGDITTADAHHTVFTSPDKFYPVADPLKHVGIATVTQRLTDVPDRPVALADEAAAVPVNKLHEAFTDNTLNVHSRFDFPENILTRLSA